MGAHPREAEAEQWAAGIPNAAYAMDDQTAITVVDGDVDFVSEGHWEQAPDSGFLTRPGVDGAGTPVASGPS
jgi:hypothetical protein